jgi:RNA polymerase sigma-70 factor (sigma-E family)
VCVDEANEKDFRAFVVARFEALRALAYVTCGDWQTAEDAVSSGLARLYVRWRTVDSPYSYARRVVMHAVIDESRRPWRRERPAGDHLPDTRLVPDTAERVDEWMRLRAALVRIPRRQRAVLVLRFYEGLSVEQTAAVLGLRAGTVRSQSSRGLATLRELLGADDITVPDNLLGVGYDVQPV